MLSARWEPRSVFGEVNRLRQELDRFFSGNGIHAGNGTVFPPLNLWEDGNALYVEAELPGLAMSDLEIVVSGDNQLSIKGERKAPEATEGTWHRQERSHGSFQRLVELPQRVDGDKVTAELKHGVLTVTLPKREELKPRRIEIKAS